MTKQEADEILSYIAREIISPLANETKQAREAWMHLSGIGFNQLVGFMYNMLDPQCKEEKPIAFEKLKKGDVFQHAGLYFMRIHDTAGFNAILLDTGTLTDIKGKTMVQPILGRLYIR